MRWTRALRLQIDIAHRLQFRDADHAAAFGLAEFRGSGYSLPSRPARRTTSPQRTISFFTNATTCSGGSVTAGPTPRRVSSAITAGSLNIAWTSRLSRAITSGGVPPGAISICHEADSKPGTVSATVGISGAA